VQQLAQTEKARDEDWLNTLRRTYPGLQEEECLAVNLIVFAMAQIDSEATADGFARQCQSEFRNLYGTDLVWPDTTFATVVLQGPTQRTATSTSGVSFAVEETDLVR
jgi:hypothetical protein